MAVAREQEMKAAVQEMRPRRRSRSRGAARHGGGPARGQAGRDGLLQHAERHCRHADARRDRRPENAQDKRDMCKKRQRGSNKEIYTTLACARAGTGCGLGRRRPAPASGARQALSARTAREAFILAELSPRPLPERRARRRTGEALHGDPFTARRCGRRHGGGAAPFSVLAAKRAADVPLCAIPPSPPLSPARGFCTCPTCTTSGFGPAQQRLAAAVRACAPHAIGSRRL